MSRSSDRINETINKLKRQFENSPYYQGWMAHEESKLQIKNDLLLSIIIPARNEWPSAAFTIHSICNALEGDGYSPKDFEIILVDNCSNEKSEDPKFWTHPLDHGTTSYLEGRGVFYSGILRTFQFPIAGNHAARNHGARIARGKYLFFSDAHMSYGPRFFKKMLEACEESGGLVHGAIAWMGGYPPALGSVGMQYTLKLGEEIKGTWAPYVVISDKWFYIAAQGHCSVMVKRSQFIEFGGYPEIHRSYGGGEFYLDMKWWMFGSSVAVHPQAIGYHLKSYRGYSWHHDDYIHNLFNVGYALGMDDWLERTYINYLRNGQKEVLDRMMEEAQKEMAEDRKFIESKRIKTFNEILVERPWDKMNLERHGVKNSSILIYHDTWLNLLENSSTQSKEAYHNSKYQKLLEEFINKNLSEYVYKRQRKSE